MVFGCSLQSRSEASFKQVHEILASETDLRVLMVGETHIRNDHHQIQLAFLQAMHERYPALAIGVEWFQQPFQTVLDNYVDGDISEADMLRKTEYFTRWRYDYRLYRPIMVYARQHRIPVVALNIEREVTNEIAQYGLNGLSESMKAKLPDDYDFSRKAYRELLEKVFEMHDRMHGQFDYFYQSQLTWDESMAQAAADYIKQTARPMIVFAGAGHIDSDHGIPSRLQRRIEIDPVTVLIADAVTDYPVDAADHLLISADRPLAAAGKLGVALEESGNLLLIRDFGENSALAAAGVPQGAAILRINEVPINSFAALKIALLDRVTGETVRVQWGMVDQQQISQKVSIEVKLH